MHDSTDKWFLLQISTTPIYSTSVVINVNLSSQCVAYIAAIEVPSNQWPEVMQALLANIQSAQGTEALKEASLQAIGYICEELVSYRILCSHD